MRQCECSAAAAATARRESAPEPRRESCSNPEAQRAGSGLLGSSHSKVTVTDRAEGTKWMQFPLGQLFRWAELRPGPDGCGSLQLPGSIFTSPGGRTAGRSLCLPLTLHLLQRGEKPRLPSSSHPRAHLPDQGSIHPWRGGVSLQPGHITYGVDGT
ncbi:PREDICTED: fibroblast growth factor 1 isoform X1 [Chinchilla lanigera]|uniref:fibroblast growth factor 1 isoform X1 n=1 Tax=Chinchilla lanigera TaxID=34839 RepID=UPI000696A713|nr:PREDICTED: fibroblast growth factor 1 isoform X1 [Chinchilla lanigera]